LVLSSEAAALAVFDRDDARERGVGLGQRRIGELARESHSCSGAWPEAKAIDGARDSGDTFFNPRYRRASNTFGGP
jgi:hypothetical protein